MNTQQWLNIRLSHCACLPPAFCLPSFGRSLIQTSIEASRSDGGIGGHLFLYHFEFGFNDARGLIHVPDGPFRSSYD
jgi:hypothetical protein